MSHIDLNYHNIMQFLSCILYAVFTQMIAAQVLSYTPRNNQAINQPPANTIRSNNLANTPNIANIGNTATFVTNTPTNAIEQAAIATNQEVDIANANIVNGLANSNLAALANLASINGNMATFNLGNGGFTVTSGSPGSPGFGIQVLADALEVGGTVAVNGQIPIYGAVAVNGHLPTDGAAAVSYTCGGSTVTENS